MDLLTIIFIILILVAAYYGLKQYMAFGVCKSRARLDGKVVIVTGANTGLGKETAKDLAARGAKVIMACRSQKRGQEALDQVKSELPSDANLILYELDLSNFASVRKFAAKFKEEESRLDILVNNAGVMWVPYSKTVDGQELTMTTNHYGHFLLTNLLLDMLKKSVPSRIVTVSSYGHKFFARMNFEKMYVEMKDFNTYFAYSQSKLANILFSKELAKRLKGTGVTTYVLNPGNVHTELARSHMAGKLFNCVTVSLLSMFIKTPEMGAQTSIYCAVAEEVADQTGLYYSDCKVVKPTAGAENEEDAAKLWEVSEKVVQL